MVVEKARRVWSSEGGGRWGWRIGMTRPLEVVFRDEEIEDVLLVVVVMESFSMV